MSNYIENFIGSTGPVSGAAFKQITEYLEKNGTVVQEQEGESTLLRSLIVPLFTVFKVEDNYYQLMYQVFTPEVLEYKHHFPELSFAFNKLAKHEITKLGVN